MEGIDIPSLGNTVQWLEEEQRQNKAVVFKFQQLVEQLQGSLWGLGDRVNTVEGAIATVMAHGSRVARLEEDLRQAREVLERLQSVSTEERQQEVAEERLRQAELERERQAHTEVLHKQELLEREQAGLRDKLQVLDEAGRRRQEELFHLEQALEPLRAQNEQLANRLTTFQDHTKRQDQALEELRQEQRSLQAQDEVTQGRVQHLGEQVHRLEGQEALRDLEQRLSGSLTEQSELHRVERQRLEREFVELQLSFEQYRSTLEDLQQELSQLQGKSQALTQYLEQVREQVWELRNDLGEQLGGVAASEEQHRRRQIAELEQQIKELRVWTPKPPRS